MPNKEVEQLTNKNDTMGIVEQVLEQAKQEGMAKGKTERDFLFVTNLLQSTDFSDEKWQRWQMFLLLLCSK